MIPVNASYSPRTSILSACRVNIIAINGKKNECSHKNCFLLPLMAIIMLIIAENGNNNKIGNNELMYFDLI